MRAAAYARYSSDKQSESSIEDQLRVVARLAERHGFEIAETFTDAAISGGTSARPGYQALLTAVRRGRFHVILAEDCSRLWRNLSEQATRLAELRDLGVHVISHDLDTRHEASAIMGAVLGATSEHYRAEIARRTRRGLEGIARAGRSAGGRAFGYIAATDSPTGQREIDPEQAAVVRRVFEMYAAGMSPKSIAATLNDEGVPSPGSGWRREQRRRRGWMVSTIAGSRERGLGLLNNELYRGVTIWNRSRWVRSALDGKKRRQVMNPPSEWVHHHDERLRIVTDDLWNRVKARQDARTEQVGKAVKQGMSRHRASHQRGATKYLFSGLLKCGTCGAGFVMADRRHYACASRIGGGAAACSNDARVNRSIVEAGLLAGIKRDVLRPELLAEIQRRVRKVLAAGENQPGPEKRIAALRAEIANLTDAIASGVLKASPAIAERLAAAEAELARLSAPRPAPVPVSAIMPRLADRCRRLVEQLESAPLDVERARYAIENLLGGPIIVETTETQIRFANEKGRIEAAFLRAAGLSESQQKDVVAGAGFEPATFGL